MQQNRVSARPDGFYRISSRPTVRPFTRQLSLWFSLELRAQGRTGHLLTSFTSNEIVMIITIQRLGNSERLRFPQNLTWVQIIVRWLKDQSGLRKRAKSSQLSWTAFKSPVKSQWISIFKLWNSGAMSFLYKHFLLIFSINAHYYKFVTVWITCFN